MGRIAVSALAACLLCVGPLSAGLIGHWPLDDGSGALARNIAAGGLAGLVGNHETGGPADGTVWVTSDDFPTGSRTVIGFGGQPGGQTAYVRAGSIPTMTLDIDFSWAFWAKQDEDIAASPGQFAGIIGNRYSDTGNRQDFSPRQFIKFTPTAFEWHMNGNGNDNLSYNPDAALNGVTPGVWEHHAVVKDGATISYYRNGQLWNSGEITQALDHPMPLWFGGDNTTDASQQWQGLLADVRTYDHALTVDELRDIPGVPEPATGLLLGIGAIALAVIRRRC